MPIYKLRGLDCGSTSSIYASAEHPPTTLSCPLDGCKARRVFTAPLLSEAVRKPFEPHYNHSVGRPVHSMKDFDDALKEGSDKASEKMGMEHNYVRIAPEEAQGVTEKPEKSSKAKIFT